MRDLKRQQVKSKKGQRNLRKRQQRFLDWRNVLHRTLRIGVTLSSISMLLVGGFFAAQLLVSSDLFRVDDITIKNGRRLTAQQVIVLSDIEIGVNTFSLDLDLIGRKIEEDPWVQQAQVQRIFPRQVVVHITERQPVAIVNLGLLYYLDDSGEIFKLLDGEDDPDFPVITGFDPTRARNHDSEYGQRLRQIVALLQNIESRDLFGLDQLSEIYCDERGRLSLFTLKGGVKVKLGSSGYSEKLDRLEHIYAQLQPKLQMLDYIDLTVDEKVIVRIERLKKTAKG